MPASFTVGIPDDLSARLKTLVEDLKVSRNSLMREGIEMVLAKYEHKIQ